MISRGFMTALMAFIHTAREFYLVSFLVGAAEAGFLAQQLNGWHSDRTLERRWHAAVSIFLCGVSLLLAVIYGSSHAIAIALFCLVGTGYYSFHLFLGRCRPLS